MHRAARTRRSSAAPRRWPRRGCRTGGRARCGPGTTPRPRGARGRPARWPRPGTARGRRRGPGTARASRNAALATTSVADDARRSSRRRRTSSPAAATTFTSQNPPSAASAMPGSGSPASHPPSCGTTSTNATWGSQRHDLTSEIAVVPASVTARNASVSSVGWAPTSGGAINAATSPYAAMLRASNRIAMITATTAAASDASRPTSGGIRPYRRVAANSEIEITPSPTPASTLPTSGERRASRTVPRASDALPAPSPMATRIGSVIQPRLNAMLRKNSAAAMRAIPPTQARARPANRSSRSRSVGRCAWGCARAASPPAHAGALAAAAAVAGPGTTAPAAGALQPTGAGRVAQPAAAAALAGIGAGPQVVGIGGGGGMAGAPSAAAASAGVAGSTRAASIAASRCSSSAMRCSSEATRSGCESTTDPSFVPRWTPRRPARDGRAPRAPLSSRPDAGRAGLRPRGGP